MERWKKDVKRAKLLVETARSSIGLTEGLSAAKIEIQALLEQYDLVRKTARRNSGRGGTSTRANPLNERDAYRAGRGNSDVGGIPCGSGGSKRL
ncbi:hypothetical protein P4H66_14310 [Paenibacillus dokdonensis]|uniref:Transposase n=1 Tax=Paenibacillus dokdonensis TaxID=2567944 RepID=A0ABU6GMR9_9BACL|nr:hypothetical protein [Paenibacillus dokdonensis]MEC0241023.1 hypothetical protein [Paenibacillus dokdonensis]